MYIDKGERCMEVRREAAGVAKILCAFSEHRPADRRT